MKHSCKCGNNQFVFIGVQTIPKQPWFLKLYNCTQCKTTRSQMFVPKDVVQGPQMPASSIVGHKPSPMPFVQKTDAIRQVIL